MSDHSKRWRERVIMAVALGLMLVAIMATLASGNEGDGEEPATEVVLLRLDGAASEIIYLPGDGGEVTQAILLDGCEAVVDDSGTVLMDITPIPPPPDGALGIFKGLGVITEGRGGAEGACGRVDGPSEGLVFALAGELAERSIESVEIDFEARRDPVIVATILNDGVVVGGAELDTSTAAEVETAEGGAVDGRFRWLIDLGIIFDELHLTVSVATPAGQFAVESGLPGTPTGAHGHEETVFKLSEFADEVGCGDFTPVVGDGEETAMASFQRGENNVDKGGDPECEDPVGFNLDSTASEDEQTVTFEFETSELPSWWGTFAWAPEPAMVPIPATDLDEDGDGVVDGVIDWCSGFEIDESGEPVPDPFTGLPKPIMPEGETWCLVEQGSELLNDGTMQVTQVIYGESDPSFARPR